MSRARGWFLNPILFGYFFTVDGIAVDDWMFSITGLAGTPDFDTCVPKFAKMLGSLGHLRSLLMQHSMNLTITMLKLIDRSNDLRPDSWAT